jgi:hypothetical protein
VVEVDEPTNTDTLVELCKFMKPTFLLLPSYEENPQATLLALEDWIERVHQHTDGSVTPCASVVGQGEQVLEWSAKMSLEHVDILYLRADRFDTFHMNVDLFTEKLTQFNEHTHFILREESMDFVHTTTIGGYAQTLCVGSTTPILATLQGVRLDAYVGEEAAGGQLFDTTLPEDYFDLTPNDINIDLLLHNTAVVNDLTKVKV